LIFYLGFKKWQIKIRSEDKEKTAFSIGNRLWQFKVMSFNLCNVPATFEHTMEQILKSYLFKTLRSLSQ